MSKDNFFSDRDARLITRMLTGGAAVGGAAGLAASLANYMKTLKAERASSADDDDTLYVTLPPQAAKSASIGGGVALTGGGLGALGSYALVRKLYQSMKKERLQKMLDQAQQGYVDTLDGIPARVEVGSEEDPEKQAADGKSMSLAEFLTSMPVAIPLVLGLGSGVVAHKLLNDAYPTSDPEKTKSIKPRRIVLRRRDDPEEDLEKAASFDLDYNLDDGAELLLHLVTSNEKSAAESELTDLVQALASGRHDELVSAFENGPEFGLSVVKGAREVPANAVSRELAHILAVKSASLGPSVKMLAAAEFAENSPGLMKAAQDLPLHITEALAGLACTYGAMLRKSAAADVLKALDIKNNIHESQEMTVDELQVPDLVNKAISASNGAQVDGGITDRQDSGLTLEKDTEESSGRDDNSGEVKVEDPVDALLTGEPQEEDTSIL